MADEKSLKIFSDKQCSKEFMQAFSHTGSLRRTCEMCGRVHFYDPGQPSRYEEGEYEELIALQKQEPERYLSAPDDSTPWTVINGKNVVLDCPCNYARIVEDFIWGLKWDIAIYLKSRADREKREADSCADAMNEIPDLSPS